MQNGYLQYPNIDPVLFQIGPVSLHWYGLMYLLGAVFAYWWGTRKAKQSPYWQVEQWHDLLFYGFLALVIGGRVGYVLFYQTSYFLKNPLYLFDITSGGMSFHGGLLGVLAALVWFARKHRVSLWQLGDFVAPMVPVGLGLGRIGNFINGELWGRVADVPWAMVFPMAGLAPRHPSQLYQAFGEGLCLFILLLWFSRKERPVGAVGGLFLTGYGMVRFCVEYFREPDAHLGLLGFFSMGQWLSLPMVGIGLIILVVAYRKNGLSSARILQSKKESKS